MIVLNFAFFVTNNKFNKNVMVGRFLYFCKMEKSNLYTSPPPPFLKWFWWGISKIGMNVYEL